MTVVFDGTSSRSWLSLTRSSGLDTACHRKRNFKSSPAGSRDAEALEKRLRRAKGLSSEPPFDTKVLALEYISGMIRIAEIEAKSASGIRLAAADQIELLEKQEVQDRVQQDRRQKACLPSARFCLPLIYTAWRATFFW